MLKKTLSFILVAFILNLAFYSTARAGTSPEKEAKYAAKVKSALTKLGKGREARVEVKLRDNTKIKGYVSDVRENSFVIVDGKTGIATDVSYLQVKTVRGKNNLNGQQIALSVAVVLVLIVIALYGGN